MHSRRALRHGRSDPRALHDVRVITVVAKAIDPTTSREESFGDSQRLRPGDIITNAVLDGRRVAIDVGVTSQAKRSQGDPIQDYATTKLIKYRRTIRNELHPEGISFRAAIWSQEGRPGKDAQEVIEGFAYQTENTFRELGRNKYANDCAAKSRHNCRLAS
jgi:hypothetical protein